MENTELFDILKEKFPLCIFTHKGTTIKMHDISMHDGFKAFDFTKFSYPYKLGVHHEIAYFLEKKGYYAEAKGESLLIKQE